MFCCRRCCAAPTAVLCCFIIGQTRTPHAKHDVAMVFIGLAVPGFYAPCFVEPLPSLTDLDHPAILIAAVLIKIY